MKIHINNPVHSTRMRVLSAFLAFLIFTLTFQEALVGWDFGMRAKADSDPSVGPDIYINTEKTSIDALKSGHTANGGKFTYTGNIKAQAISLYDYLSDEEIKNSGSWNTGITKSRVGGYIDPYTVFNKAVSDYTPFASDATLSAASENITVFIEFDYAPSTLGRNVYCHLYRNGTSEGTKWRGFKMELDSTVNEHEIYKYTFCYESLGFIPDKLIFSTDGDNWQYTVDVTLQKGKKYYYKKTFSGNTTSVTLQDSPNNDVAIYTNHYLIPLYFGCFLEYNDNNSADSQYSYKCNDLPGINGSSTTTASEQYNNFSWLPNMAQREKDTTDPVYNGAGHSAVQGLVDSTLDANGNLTQGGKVLPYFSKTWADSNKYGTAPNQKPIMKYWESGKTDADKIAFPFYEVLTDTTDSSHNGATGAVAGTNYNTKYAKYYQFDSKDANLLFHDAISSTKAHFSETSTPIKTNNESNRNGFFPFNSSNNDSGSDINCGFGTKIEIPFKLEPDGTVKMVNASGESEDGAGTVHARFEFSGDDDLWVFLDDKLMLDMGGAHNKATGYIDFATKTAQADNAYAYTAASQNNLGFTGASHSLTVDENSTVKFSERFKTGSFDVNGKYTNIQHKLTIFYMERGMLDSNLMIRYNFNAESNFSKMKVQEVTSFENVNAGLVSATMQAANKDVFKYTVSNTGTNKAHVINASIPTNGNHERTVGTDTTILTKEGTNPTVAKFQPNDTTNKYPVADIPYLWVDDFAQMNSAKNGGSGKGAQSTSNLTADKGSLYLMYGTEVNNTVGTVKKESSAEFEGQFDRYSVMEVIQATSLYTPTANGSNPATLSGTTSRTVSEYYTTHKYLWSRNTTSGHEKDVELAVETNTFKFMNDNLATATEGDSDTTLAPQMTELFTNTVKTGAISVTKSLDPDDTVNDDFEFTIQLTNVFGVPNVNVTDYTGIKYTRSDDLNTELNLATGGKFTIKKGQTATISGIPVGTHYVISETSPSTNYQFKKVSSGSLSGDKTTTTQTATVVNTRRLGTLTLTKNTVNTASRNNFDFEVTLNAPNGVNLANYSITKGGTALSSQPTSGNSFTVNVPVSGSTGTVTLGGIPYGTTYTVTEANGSKPTGDGAGVTGEVTTPATIDGVDDSVTIINTFPEVHEYPVTVTKTGENSDDMSGAEFELWYKETVPPQTYSFNEPKIAPNEINGMKVTETPASVGVPSPVVPKSVTNYTVTTTYADPSVPNADEEEWILPRNDTDYIYFRDYNDKSESGAAYGEWDEGSFNSSDKYAWRSTTFIHHQVHNQDLELSYDESKWFAAEFSGNGKKTVRYAVWERFVDEYSDKTTVIWKIQPPDGYTDVRFMLLKGDTVIRKTVKFKYELGKIYHKTNWGGYWTSQNGQNCYYDVPVTQESATNNGYWAPKGTESTINDKRMSAAPYTDSAEITYTRQMLQARKYEPTAQKVIFHCNSKNVWHNIHIEFFEDAQGNNPVNGQAFPGYMMEPFAYAGNNYRLGNYLTYELTIPANAKYFRINNGEAPSTYHGETSGTYSYQTAIMPLKNATTGEGQKNYGNYWCFGSYSNTGATLVQWTPTNEENGGDSIPDKDYKNAEVTSDYDYIYFKNTDNWSKVYAYFYAGGDLRGDNWQRATYSSWPGVAPAGTEYTNAHSNTYSIQTAQASNKYNGTDSSGTLNPVATFTSGDYTIYKFRIPKGDRKNYSKVIFNSGLGGTETGVIDYQPGHMYDKNGKSEKHYENSPTKLYTASTNSNLSGDDKTEYIYVKNTLSGWDDLHVTFYDANGGQILQGGKGYVMEYAGNSTNDYFKIPLPADAVSFSVNNGIGNNTEVSQKADIIRLDGTTNGKTKSTKGADDRFVYTLSGSGTSASPYVLTRDGFTTTSTAQTSRPAPQEEGFADYTVAVAATDTAPATYSVRQHGTTPNIVEHTLNIRDAANWNVDIGRISVTFYKSDGSQIGPNVMIKTVADAQGKVWYTKKIHPDAVSFTVSYSVGTGTNPTTYTTPKYPIYPYSASAPADGSNYTSTGHMFFDTVGTGANSKLVMTHEEPVNADNAVDDETYSQRGDYLYLIYPANDSKEVTFYASGDNVIKSGIKAKYINHDSEGYWYKVAIPTGAQSFTATGMSGNKADIYELRSKFSPYRKDYTLGDMQYRISDGATLLYPVFTADTYNTLDVSTGNTISSRTPILVDETQISAYEGASAATLPTSSGSTPAKEILYNTSSDNVTYSWTEGTSNPNYNYVSFVDVDRWGSESGTSKLYAYFFGGSGDSTVSANSSGTYTLNGNTYYIYKFSIPSINPTNVIFKSTSDWNCDNTHRTINIDLIGNGHGYVYYPLSNTYTVNNENKGRGVQVSEPSGASVVISSDESYETKDYIYFYEPNGSINGKGFHNKTKAGVANGINAQNIEHDNNMISSNNLYDSSGFTLTNLTGITKNLWKYPLNNYEVKYVKFFDDDNNTTISTEKQPSGESNVVVKGHAYIINVTNGGNYTNNLDGLTDQNSVPLRDLGEVQEKTGSTTVTFSGAAVSPGSSTTYTYSYQPEDRYGMISDANTNGVVGTADANDFITVVLPSTISEPYIKFYANTDGTSEINSGTSTKGLLLKPDNSGGSGANGMKLNGTAYTPETATNTYKVRLPKDAGSFKILNGTTHVFTQTLKETGVQTVMTALGENNQPINQTVTVPGTFYHAGTTFTYDGSTVTKTLRTGFTPYKQSTMVDPLDPMTDNDFIYFTDTGSFANSGKVFAYFYGGADGEYKAWPGTVATTTNNQDVAATTYTDNNGKTVYKFRVPKDSDGSYTNVIFNNGQSGNDLKITAAQTVVGGMNYTLGNYIGQDYGTMTAENKVFAVTTANKALAATATYSNSANKTIYFINNGTKCVVAGETDRTGDRYILDDIHVEFFTSEGSGAIGTADPGYIPQKVGTKDGYDVYRIVAPNNAQYFRINNGTGKGAVTGSSTHNHDRKSEIKLLSNNGLYSFVTDATKYTKDGTQPSTIQTLSQPEYLLQLVNPRAVDPDEQSDAEHFDVKLAVVKTGSSGAVDEILWLKNSLSNVDTAYLANANNNTTPPVKVVKNGEYYWKEVTPPSGYKLPDTTIQTFTLPTTGSTTTTFTDPKNPTGSLTLKKKLLSVSNSTPVDEEKKTIFKFTIELIAPVGTDWKSSNISSSITIKDGSDTDKYSDWFVSDNKTTTTSLVRTVVVKLPADGQAYVTIGGLPYGTTYSVTEQPIKMAGNSLTEVPNTDYTSEPIIINKSVKETSSSTAVDSTAESVDGTIENYSTSYLLTNKHEVGSLNLKDIVVDHGVNALYHANVNQEKKDNGSSYDPKIFDWYPYNYKVTLISPDNVDLDDYITEAQLNAITGISTSGNVTYTARTATRGATTTQSQYEFHIHVTSAPDGMRTISNIPLGTQYTVVEELPTDTYETDKNNSSVTNTDSDAKADVTWWKSGDVTPEATPKYITAEDRSPTVTITNNYQYEPRLILQKTKAVTAGSALPATTASGGTQQAGLDYFVYTVTLVAPDNKKWNDPSFNWSTAPNNITGIPAGTDKTGNTMTFTVNVTPGTDTIIYNLPVGTEYSVQELSADNPVPSGYKCVTSPASNSGTVGDGESVAAFTNTYTQAGELELKKDLAGEYVAAGRPTNYSFTYHVTLTAPNDKTWAQLANSGFSITNGTDAGGAVIANVSMSEDGKTYSFDVTNVSVNGTTAENHIKITSIPYGTTYTVTETTETISGFVHTKSGEVKTPAEESPEDKAKRTIGSATQVTPTITNTYTQVGSLTINKTLAGADVANSDKTDASKFTFIVKITMASGVDKNVYINNVTPEGTLTNSNYTEPTGSELGSFTFEVTASHNAPVTIGNLPYGSAYTVVETDPGNGWTSSPFVITDSIDASQKTAAFTNTFARSLTLRKVDSRTQELITSPAQFVLLRLPSSSVTDLQAAIDGGANDEAKLAAAKSYATASYPSDGTYFQTDSTGMFTINELQVGGRFGTDNFFFFEVSAPTGYVPDNTVTESRIFHFESGDADKIVTFPNGVQPTDVTVEKQDDNGNGLGDAELDLYYQENIVPSTYNINPPVTEPLPIPTRQIGGNKPTVPDVDGSTTKTTFEYSYTPVSEKPNAEENAWILPRTDNDYIYFRDFNIGTTAEWDDVEVTNSSNGNKRYWLKTTLGYNEHGQVQEINYNHDYWFAAKFYNNNGDVKYAMWERFVDKYTHDGHTYDTIVWKIQPPDGYDRVRFCLYKGDNCVRNTQEITFQLGKVYTKKGWGTEYKEEYGNKCYFNVPVDVGENWSTYYTNPQTNETMDKRNQATTQLYQADRYTATPQKVVFHCNSNQVWHNIHIEFFDKNQQPIGQKFPGYMMEPYAKADHDTYRINGYLSYELTIPEGARYFRINNGIDNSSTKGAFNSSSQAAYAYRTEIKALYTGTETVEGKTASQYKNYHNYFHLGKSSGSYPGGVNVGNGSEVKLSTWQNDFITGVGDNLYEQFDNTNEIEADGDYIYLALPKNNDNSLPGNDWNKAHVYAYFYGGGNLRQDNWQRACYSIWPGVAPVSTEYTTYTAGINTGTDTHSDIYTYSYDGTLYESGAASISNPETTFDYTRDDKKYIVYKFRVPLGDRTNYDFVIFNDGTVKNGGGRETDVIDYSAGTLYLADRTADSHNYKQSTDLYTSRGDYLYVRMDSTTLNTWDDLHVTFYNANGTQILQGGTGYVMKYAGTDDGYTYFKVPVPDNAKKFSLNNGYDNNAKSIGTKTAQYDILTKVATAQNEGETEGGMLYTLSGTSLTLTEPTMTITKHTEETGGSYALAPTSSPRGDFIYIRDDAGKFTNTTTVTFKDAAGNVITKSIEGTPTSNFLPVNKHVVENGGDPQWYSVGIPVEAVSFTVNDGTTDVIIDQLIFAKTTETVGTADNFTTDGMYFKTTDSTPVLEILWPTFTQAEGTTNYNDDNYSDGGRGDALYIITPNRNDWTGQYVVFYDEDGEPIKNTSDSENIGANYIGELTAVSEGESPVPGVSTDRTEAVGHWFKAYIPTNAKTFKVFSSDNTELGQGDIYKLRTKTARYHDDYTLGDMEYRLSGSALTKVYPVFTEIPPSSSQELEVSKRANETAASQYIASPVASEGGYHSDSAMPVLYPTGASISNTITYEWTEGATSSDSRTYLYWAPNSSYNNVQFCWFYDKNGSHLGDYVKSDYYLEWENSLNDYRYPRIDRQEGNYNGGNVRKVKIPPGAVTVEFACTKDHNNSTNAEIYRTGKITIADIPIGKGVYVKKTKNLNNHYGDAEYDYFDLSDATNATLNDGSSTTATYLYSYQPEDRYGFISGETGNTLNDRADENNFITLVIPNSVTKPYIKFYSDTSGNTEINTATTGDGKTKSTKGLLLNPDNTGGTNANNMKLNDNAGYTCLTNNSTNNTYMVRLPKDAKSFKVFNDTTQIGSVATALYENRVESVNETNVTLTNYHNAGTTYTVDTTNNTVTAGPRRVSTLFKSPISTLEYKTDYDYIFFTDDGTVKGSESTVYAYFFGGKDGAYKVSGNAVVTDTDNSSWYGVSPSYTYVDNSGNTVYAFRYPTSTNGDYPYVMFNNGAYNNTVRVTEAVAYAPGTNYRLAKSGSDLTVNYGTKSAYKLTSTAGDKTSTETVRYSTTKTNGQYLIFHNNGTYSFGVDGVAQPYVLDDLHITFYEDAEGGSPVGNASPGYRMNKLTVDRTYYRITIPNGARYFRINNGINKTNGTTNNNYRESVIEQIAANGIYEFVSGTTDAKDIWNSDETPAAVSELNAHSYYLTLKNPLDDDEDEIPEVTRDIWLATVVTDGTTGHEGKQKYIKRLKPLPKDSMPEGKEYDPDDADTYQPSTVDTNYLDHVIGDIYDPATNTGKQLTTVKVIKKGTYYWKESIAPAGYEMNEDKHYFTVKSGTEPDKIVVKDKPISGEVILTKVSKDKVGTTDIGETLAGAKFQLIKIEGNSEIDTIRFSKSSNTEINEYSLGSTSATYNAEGHWLETDKNGKLKLMGLAPGDYCLVEQEGSKGYSAIDANTGTNRRVYFSTGANTKKKEIVCADDMDPAYIRLFEHINEWRPNEWGNPTFVFKITRKDHYEWSSDSTPVWQLTGTETNEQEMLVALTVNEDGKITDQIAKVLKWIDRNAENQDDRNKFFTTDPIDNEKYGDWFVEATSEDEYNGLFRIDEQGRIRVQPGKYEVTRLPVSRYEFVTSGHIVYTTDTNPGDTLSDVNSTGTEAPETVTLTAGQTADIHYYDKVGYYDKFTQVDEEINAFHRYKDAADNNTVKKSVKGIRIYDYQVDTDEDTENRDTLDSESDTLTVNITSSPRFKAYFICADGSERALTPTEMANLKISYEYDAESGDKVSFGNAGEGKTNDFSYDTTTDVITVTNYTDYINGVYTLKATYVGDSVEKFSTSFDIVFERTAPSNP